MLPRSPTSSRLPATGDARRGDQAPTIYRVPEYVDDALGLEAVDFMADVGAPLLPWQATINTDQFGRRADGRWAAYETAVMEARQNGKGRVAETGKLFGAFMLREKRIVFSAHLFETSRVAFEKLLEIIDGSDWLTKRVHSINQAHGKEGVTLTRAAGGGKIRYKARTVHGTRGSTGERVILDEAYGLTVGQFAAISPILATIDNPSITYLSSPPDEKTGPMPEDAILPSIRKRGIAGDPQLLYAEWSPPAGFTAARDAGDVDVWYRTNPSMGYLISEEFLRRQYRIFEAAGRLDNFATEHLGAWPAEEAPPWQVITESDWATCRDPESRMVGRPVLVVTMSQDRQWVVITAAGARADGLRHVQVLDSRPGSGWVVEQVRELRRRWRPWAVGIRPTGPAGSLLGPLESARIDVTRVNIPEGCQGAGMFFDAVTGVRAETGEPTPRLVRHIGQGVLDVAVARAMRRKVNNVWTWDMISPTVDCSPLEGVSDAFWLFTTKGRAGAPAAARQTTTAGKDFFRSGGRLKV